MSPTAEVWTPLQHDVSLPINGREWGHHLQLVARLADGASVDTAARELDEIAKIAGQGAGTRAMGLAAPGCW